MLKPILLVLLALVACVALWYIAREIILRSMRRRKQRHAEERRLGLQARSYEIEATHELERKKRALEDRLARALHDEQLWKQ